MCVAVYKKSGVELPSREVFKECFDTNPDGAGFAVKRKDDIIIHKGFFKIEEFFEALELAKVSKDDECFFHFRIATHGGISKGCCHPFPVATSIRKLKKHNYTCREVLMHNGVLPLLPRRDDISDTMELCLELGALKDRVGAFEDYGEKVAYGNRLALMRVGADTILTGQWHDIDGVLFSNLNWQPYTGWQRWAGYDIQDYGDISYPCDDCKHYGSCGLEYSEDCEKCQWYEKDKSIKRKDKYNQDIFLDEVRRDAYECGYNAESIFNGYED